MLKLNPPHVGFFLSAIEEVLEICICLGYIVGIYAFSFLMVLQNDPIFSSVSFVLKVFNDGISLIVLRDKIHNESMDLCIIDRDGFSR